MHFKLIIALVDTDDTHAVMDAARNAGAAGATIVSQARGEGVESAKTFLGLTLETQRDMLLFLVEEHLCRSVLETIERVARLEEDGKGIAFQIDVEDAVGVSHQIQVLTARVEEEL
jgi:nitrogen regulatory protein PII